MLCCAVCGALCNINIVCFVGILLSHSDAIQRLMDTTLTPDDTVGSMNDCSASAGSPPVADIEDSQSCRQRVVPYGYVRNCISMSV